MFTKSRGSTESRESREKSKKSKKKKKSKKRNPVIGAQARMRGYLRG